MRSVVKYVCCVLPALFSSGCGRNEVPQVAGIVLESSAAADPDGALVAARDKGILFKVVGYDDSGSPAAVEEGELVWETGDPATLELTPLGGSCLAVGVRDWFDTLAEEADPANGREPSATVTVRYRGLAASATMRVVINVEGTWVAAFDDGRAYVLELSQSERRLTYEAAGSAGTIIGNALTVSIQGYEVTAWFRNRTMAMGVYVGPDGGAGIVGAVKL